MLSIERASLLKHEEKKIRELNYLLQKLTQEECQSPGFFSDEIISIKKRLEHLDTEQYKGALVRARWRRLSLSEIPKKRAVGIERTYASNNEVSEILYRGTLSSDKETIEGAFVDYYKELFSYRAPKKDGCRSLYLPLMPKLTDDLKEKKLEQPTWLWELEKAIDNLHPGSHPAHTAWEQSSIEPIHMPSHGPQTWLLNDKARLLFVGFTKNMRRQSKLANRITAFAFGGHACGKGSLTSYA